MREREAFRDHLQSLREQFAGQEVLTLDQSSKLLGLDREDERQWHRNTRICTRGRAR